MSNTWKTVRVFISSTFRDMHAERDHLVKVVFPKLRHWCEDRKLHLVDIVWILGRFDFLPLALLHRARRYCGHGR